MTVEEVLDYGDKKYTRLRLNETTFCIEGEGGTNVMFDFDDVKVYDSDIDMRLF